MIVLRTLCANAAGRLTNTAEADLRTHCVLAAAACASVQGLLQRFRVWCNHPQILKYFNIQLEQQLCVSALFHSPCPVSEG